LENRADHPNIEVRLNTDYFEAHDDIPERTTIVHTGPLNKYFRLLRGDCYILSPEDQAKLGRYRELPKTETAQRIFLVAA
jgi:UDP-galactopyranose mutase